jgi:hypothetical protein
MDGLKLGFNGAEFPRNLILTYMGLERFGSAPRISRSSRFRLFDFGGSLSPKFRGAVRVGPEAIFDGSKPYGWVEKPPYLGLCPGGPDRLTEDMVVPGPDGRGRMRFRVVTGPGEKLVWCLALPFNGRYGPVHPYSILADGEKKVAGGISAGDFLSANGLFRWTDSFFSLDQDPWAVYVNPFYRQHLFRVPVREGGDHFDLEFENLSLFALGVFPSAKEKAGLKILGRIQNTRRDEFRGRQLASSPSAEAEEKDEGTVPVNYILFHRDSVEDVQPDTEPRPEDVTATLEAVLARGETEHVTFTIHPLADLGRVTVTVDEPADGKGRRFSGEISVRVVRYAWPGLIAGNRTYQPTPAYLWPLEADLPVSAGVNRRIWLTVRAGRRSRAGEYIGTIRIEPESGEASRLGLKIRVLPLTLPAEIPIKVVCSYPGIDDLNYHLGSLSGIDSYREEIIRREVRNLKIHGFNGMDVPGPEIVGFDGSRPVLDFSDLDTYLAILQSEDFGLDHRCTADIFRSVVRPLAKRLGYGSRSFGRALTQVIRDIESYQVRNKFYFYHYLGEGPWSSDRGYGNVSRDDGLRLGRLLEGVRGARSVMEIRADIDNGDELYPLALPLTAVITRPWNQSRRLIVQANLENRRELWYTGLPAGRFVGGFFLWRSHPEGLRMGPYESRPFGFYPFDFTGRSRGLVFPSPSGPVDTPDYERFSRGLDDYRFLLALESMIGRGSRRGETGRLKGEIRAYLKELERNIPAINVDPETDVRYWREVLNEFVVRLAAVGRR